MRTGRQLMRAPLQTALQRRAVCRLQRATDRRKTDRVARAEIVEAVAVAMVATMNFASRATVNLLSPTAMALLLIRHSLGRTCRLPGRSMVSAQTPIQARLATPVGPWIVPDDATAISVIVASRRVR